MIRLVWRQIFGHKVRSLLTIGAVLVGVFLLCLLHLRRNYRVMQKL